MFTYLPTLDFIHLEFFEDLAVYVKKHSQKELLSFGWVRRPFCYILHKSVCS